MRGAGVVLLAAATASCALVAGIEDIPDTPPLSDGGTGVDAGGVDTGGGDVTVPGPDGAPGPGGVAAGAIGAIPPGGPAGGPPGPVPAVLNSDWSISENQPGILVTDFQGPLGLLPR